jgi:hypothetical protein
MDAGHLKGRVDGNVFAAVGLNALRRHMHAMFSYQYVSHILFVVVIKEGCDII